MIGRLKGILVHKQPPWLVVDVHGVGYELEAPMSTFYDLPELGREVVQQIVVKIIFRTKIADPHRHKAWLDEVIKGSIGGHGLQFFNRKQSRALENQALAKIAFHLLRRAYRQSGH